MKMITIHRLRVTCVCWDISRIRFWHFYPPAKANGESEVFSWTQLLHAFDCITKSNYRWKFTTWPINVSIERKKERQNWKILFLFLFLEGNNTYRYHILKIDNDILKWASFLGNDKFSIQLYYLNWLDLGVVFDQLAFYQ